ncbi:MAG TPA: acyl-CoA dehydrogenase family protein [Alphaproteobacteria bacterium]|nr:acyl-CoA dehydrogenase family protein [Alphaproteobacteria bacterium]
MRDAVHHFAQGVIAPMDASSSQRQKFSDEAWLQMGTQGFLGVTAEEIYGGLGLGYLAQCVIAEEISRASGSIGLSYIAHANLCVNQIALNGSEEQKQRFLPRLTSGEFVGALAMSEANSGSDVMSMHTRAEPVEGGYQISGTKLWITNGGNADVILLYAKTGERLTAFLTTRDMEGFSVGQKIHKNGMRGSDTYEIRYDNCFVPIENRVGAEGSGGGILMSGLNYERLVLSAGALGLAQAALDEALKYTRDREQFRKRICDNQAVAFELADMQANITRERAALYAYANLLDQLGPQAKQDKDLNGICAGVFLTAALMATDVANRALVLHGGNGMTEEFKIGRILNDVKLYEIGGGTTNIRRLQVARGLGCQI